MAGFDTIIKVSGSIVADTTTNSISSIDMPEDGLIMCIGGLLMGTYAPSPAVATNITLQLTAELSFLSTNQISTNDARGTIAGIGVSSAVLFGEATETGAGGYKLSEMDSICLGDGIIVNAGERIHLHGDSSQPGLTGTATFLLYIKNKGGARRSVARR